MEEGDFVCFYRDTYALTRRILGSACQDSDSLADLMQEVYLAAWLRFHDRPHPNPQGWLVLTARNKAADLHRRRAYEPVLYGLMPPEGRFAFAPRFRSAEEVFFSSLPEENRIRSLLTAAEYSLLTEHYDEQRPMAELSARFRASPAALYMRLSRTRRKLERLLQAAS